MSTTTFGGASAWGPADDDTDARSARAGLVGARRREDGPRSPARSLVDIFTATVLRCGEKPAIDAPDGVFTYDELRDAALAVAVRLRTLGIGPGDRVGVRITSGTAQLYVGILGVLHAGAAYVPVDAEDPEARAAELWRQAGACAVLGDGLTITELAPATGGERELTVDDDSWVIFTSGSSGAPKGVAVTHRAAAAFVDAEAQLWHIDVDDRVLAGLSVSFDASCEEMWLAWRHGAALVPAPRSLVRSGAELGFWIADCRITVVSTVPTLAAMWELNSLTSVRLLILGGEACPEGLGWRLAEDREVWNTYGPTEATVVSTAARIRPGRPVTIGWPLSGWQVAVLGVDGEPAPLGEEGELVIGGDGVARYLDQALDAERFAAIPGLGWERAYRTGDIVRETADGFDFVGRRDDQVKLGGRRVELGEIDAQLNAVAGVKAALAAVRETAAGNRVLVGYVVADAQPEAIRAALAKQLPAGLVPLIVSLDSMPRGASGKVDRKALPWPPPDDARAATQRLAGTAAWVAECWIDQLGPLPLTVESDFFQLGGSSLAAAKLASALRSRFPAVAVADIYQHRKLGELSDRLDQLGAGGECSEPAPAPRRSRWGLVQLAGVFALLTLAAPQWLVGILAFDHWHAGQIGPQVGWGWLIAGWLVFASAPGRATIVALARAGLLSGLTPGRYPRRSWLGCRMWFVERLAELCRLESLAGTPWAARYARLSGHRVGTGARLGTLPPATSLVSIGAGATLEADVDMHGWWIEADELVIGALHIGDGARVGSRTLLMPGSEVGDGAEIEPGSVVRAVVPAGERWAGSPAARVGVAGERWPDEPAPAPHRRRLWRAMYGVGVVVQTLLPLLAAVPGILLLSTFGPEQWTATEVVNDLLLLAPVLAATFVLTYGLLVALLARMLSPLIRPGWHADEGATAWTLWFAESLMAGTRDLLFPLYSSIYTRPWLRLAGIKIGPRTEISTAVGLNHLTSFERAAFAADDVVFASGRARDGWLHVAAIEVGNRSFLGNGAILAGSTRVGDDSLVGLLTTAPEQSSDGTSWLGSPALELPRRPEPADPLRTTDPPRRLVAARAMMDLIRILAPGSISVVLASLVFWSLDALGAGVGVWAMAVAAPFVLTAAGLCAMMITVAIKWLVIGRYRSGEHALWSLFVWRDEIINSSQEQLAGAWLLNVALGTPLMSAYLRLMGSKVGRDVWCETLTITEFDLATLGDGCAVNRHSVVETHVFHDRLMRIGSATLGAGATLGPSSAMLPDTTIGDGCSVGGRSIVMRGERLPARTRWHGAPVVAK